MSEEAEFDFDDDRGFDDYETPGAGTYHMSVQDIEENGGKDDDQLVVDFVVLSPGEYQGLVYKDYIPMGYEDWARKKRYKLAVVLGMTTLADLKKGGVVLEWETAVGKECVIELIEDKWEDNKGNARVSIRSKWPENYISLENKAAIKKRGCVLAGDQKKGGKVSSESKPKKDEAPPAESDDDEVPF